MTDEVRLCVIANCKNDAEGWYACRQCEQRMSRWLRHLPEDSARIKAELETQRSKPKGTGKGDPAVGALPGGTDLMSAATSLGSRSGEWLQTLASWQSCLMEERSILPPATPGTLTEVCRWLGVHLQWSAQHFPAIDEFHRELRDVVKGVRGLLADERTMVPLGRLTCPADVEEVA